MLAGTNRNRDKSQQRIERGTCMGNSQLFKPFLKLMVYRISNLAWTRQAGKRRHMQLQSSKLIESLMFNYASIRLFAAPAALRNIVLLGTNVWRHDVIAGYQYKQSDIEFCVCAGSRHNGQ